MPPPYWASSMLQSKSVMSLPGTGSGSNPASASKSQALQAVYQTCAQSWILHSVDHVQHGDQVSNTLIDA